MVMAPADASARGAPPTADEHAPKRPAPSPAHSPAAEASPEPASKAAKAASPAPIRSLAEPFAAAKAARPPLPAMSAMPAPASSTASNEHPSADADELEGAHCEPALGVRAALERMDCEAGDEDIDAFLGQLKGGSAGNVSFVVGPLSGFYVPDDSQLLREVEHHFKAFSELPDTAGVQALRVPVLIGARACCAIVVHSGHVNEAKHFVQCNMSSSFPVAGVDYIAYPSLQAFINTASAQVDREAMPSFTMMLSGLPCVNEATTLVYKHYFEKVGFSKRKAVVESVVSLKTKSCGVRTRHDEGVLIIKFYVPDAEHLRRLRATRVPAFLDGAPAGYFLSTRCGNLKIIDVNGEKVESLSCCGVLKGEPHRHDDCVAYLCAKHARTELVAKLAPMRQHRAQVSARAGKYYNACTELEKLAKKNGYVKCKRFFNTGRCTFAEGQLGCRHFPCKPEYSERDGAVRMLLDSIK